MIKLLITMLLLLAFASIAFARTEEEEMILRYTKLGYMAEAVSVANKHLESEPEAKAALERLLARIQEAVAACDTPGCVTSITKQLEAGEIAPKAKKPDTRWYWQQNNPKAY